MLCLAGCVVLSQPAPPIRDYRLDYPPPTISGTPLDVRLRVSRLGVAAIYDRQAIAYSDGTYTTGSYLYDRWATNPGSMIADLLARDFAASALYHAVQQGSSLLPSDYVLTGHIETIEERVHGTTCGAHLELRILLLRVRAPGADPVALRAAYSEEEPCPCISAGELAAAMSRALQRISAALQADVYAAIAGQQ